MGACGKLRAQASRIARQAGNWIQPAKHNKLHEQQQQAHFIKLTVLGDGRLGPPLLPLALAGGLRGQHALQKRVAGKEERR